RDFLHPTFRPFVLVTGVVLLVMAVGIWLVRPEAESCCHHEAPCGHDESHSAFGPIFRFAVLILPLLVAALFSPGGFGVTAVLNRGVVTDPAALRRSESGVPASVVPKPGAT